MDKAALVQHLADITVIMDYHQRLGTTVNPLIAEEFTNREKELHSILKQEQDDEARKREQQRRSDEGRTEATGNLPRRD